MKMKVVLIFYVVAFSAGFSCTDLVLMSLNNTFSPTEYKDHSSVLEIVKDSGKSIGELGHYDKCIRDGSNFYIFTVPIMGINTFSGVCLPAECSKESVQAALSGIPSIKVTEAENFPLGTAGYLTITFIFLVFGLGIAGSFYGPDDKSKGIHSVIRCFSLRDNYKSLMSVRKCKPGDHSNVLDGIRVLSMLLVISGHCFTFKTHNAIVNLENFETRMSAAWWDLFIFLGEYSVDTFFWMGGFLLGYLLLQEVEKKRGKFGALGWSLVYIHRILRILPVYAFMLLFSLSVFPSISTGPMWFNHNIVTKDCSEYWWTVLTFTNNFIPGGYGNQCMGIGWYLADDMQFFALGPLLILLYYFSARWLSWVFKVVLFVLGYIISFYIAQEYDFQVHMISSKNAKGGSNDYYHMYYTKPYTRFFPYIAGLYCGYVFLRYSKKYISKEEDTHKDHICSTLIKYWRHPVFSWVFFGTGLFLGFMVLYLQKPLYRDPFNEDVWSPTTHHLLLPLKNIVFSYALCCVLMPMIMGKINAVSRVLGAGFFSPLAKLTFSCYLVQFMFLLGFFASTHFSVFFIGFGVFKDSVCGAVLCYAISLVVYLLIEAPFGNLEKLGCSMLKAKH